MNDSLVEDVLFLLRKQGAEWKVGGELRSPTKDDVRRTLDRLYLAVYDGEEQTQASTGGILVKKEYGRIDVYTYIGELNDDD